MYDPMTDVMLRSVTERQARLRERHHLLQAVRANRPATPSRVRRTAGEILIRLGERLRGEFGEAAAAAQSELATS